MNVEEIREAYGKWYATLPTQQEYKFAKGCSSERLARAFYGGYQAALSTIDPELKEDKP